RSGMSARPDPFPDGYDDPFCEPLSTPLRRPVRGDGDAEEALAPGTPAAAGAPLGVRPGPQIGPQVGPQVAPTGPKLYKVGELTRVIKARLEELGRVSVEGEVTRITLAASGHLYFSLKDIDAKIDCTIWKSNVQSALRFELKEGMQVIAHGKLDVYGPRGTYSLNVQRLEEAGIGALLVKLE